MAWCERAPPDAKRLSQALPSPLEFHSFGAGVRKLTGGRSEAEVDAWTVAYGFDLDELDLGRSGGPRAAYQALTDAWRDELSRRQGGGRR
jgi:hypothetical protein